MIYVILIAAGLLTAAFFIIRGQVQKIKGFKTQIKTLENANERLHEAVKKREHILKRMEEVNADAAEQKREIRNHNDSGDRTHAATNAMRKLSRRGSGNDTASED